MYMRSKKFFINTREQILTSNDQNTDLSRINVDLKNHIHTIDEDDKNHK